LSAETVPAVLEPTSAGEAAEALRAAGADGRRVRPRGGATKLGWGRPVDADAELSMRGLDAIVEHNAGDFTAVVQAGVPLSAAQEAFAAEGQMLSWDPPLGAGGAATIGGIVATADSGPLRHRFGAVRDLVLGVQLALPDGTVARAGSKVIKNVAGYDLAKLFTGSYGTLGVVVEMSVRLHPRPATTATAVGRAGDAGLLCAAASALAHRPLEHVALDVAWDDGHGAVLARFAGTTAAEQARAAMVALAEAGVESELAEDDAALWDGLRDGQRSRDGTVVHVSSTQTGLLGVLRAAEGLGARVVARAALGLAWVTLPRQVDADAVAAVGELRAKLAPAPCVVLDAPAGVRCALDPWDTDDPALLELTRRVKERFDPQRTCNPGLYVGGI
jgi:glycolate oxidase FAD binding subunit